MRRTMVVEKDERKARALLKVIRSFERGFLANFGTAIELT